MGSPSNGNLPADVIQEILLRLPVKTLLRFKCVCKYWYALIGSPSFAKQHFGHVSNQERLLIRQCKLNEEGNTFALYVDDMCSGYEEPDHLQMPDTVKALLGPLNGIFCMVTEAGHLALLNPAMRQFKPLPLHHQNVQPLLYSSDDLAGFGLDPSSGDYKLVWVRCFLKKELNVTNRIYPPFASIYNVATDSWRHFEDVDLLNLMSCEHRSLGNTCLNGIYYTLVLLQDDTDAAILAFDMSSENFQQIQVPNCIISEERDIDLALYGDSIALLSYDYGEDKIDKCLDIWVMKKDGCWTKSSTIGISEDMKWPLCFWKNNELLLEGANSVLAFDVSNQYLRAVATQREEGDDFYDWVFSYKESLVSIKQEGDNCKLWDTSSDFVKNFFGDSSSNR